MVRAPPPSLPTVESEGYEAVKAVDVDYTSAWTSPSATTSGSIWTWAAPRTFNFDISKGKPRTEKRSDSVHQSSADWKTASS
jgi:hypothetical protein